MFHELSHQVVYIADDTAFNEAFAVTVEQEGLARWLKFRGREDGSREVPASGARARPRASRSWRDFAASSPCCTARRSTPRSMRARKARGVRAAGDASCARSTSALAPKSQSRGRARRQAQQCAPRLARHLLRLRAGIRARCWPSSSTTCRASTRRCARSPNYRAKNGARGCAVRRPNPSLRRFVGVLPPYVTSINWRAGAFRAGHDRPQGHMIHAQFPSGHDRSPSSIQRAANGSSMPSRGCCAIAAAIPSFSKPRWCCRSRSIFRIAA